MGVSDIFVFVADAIYDYALAADTMQDTDEDDQESEGADDALIYHMFLSEKTGNVLIRCVDKLNIV